MQLLTSRCQQFNSNNRLFSSPSSEWSRNRQAPHPASFGQPSLLHASASSTLYNLMVLDAKRRVTPMPVSQDIQYTKKPHFRKSWGAKVVYCVVPALKIPSSQPCRLLFCPTQVRVTPRASSRLPSKNIQERAQI